MRHVTKIGLAMALTIAAAVPCPANQLVNGSFETPALPAGNYVTVTPGSEPAGFAWRIASGNADFGHLPVTPFVNYLAFEDSQVLDLNGTVRGAVFQDFATAPGQVYRLTLAYADNPSEGGASTASIHVTDGMAAASLLSATIAHSTSTNGPPPNGDWQIFSDSFTAISALTRLTLSSTSASNSASGGIILDAVSVVGAGEDIPGDFDRSGCVDHIDYAAWLAHYGMPGTRPEGDGNGDAQITAADYSIWADHYGEGACVVAFSAVPEPSAIVLAVMGAAVAMLGRTRRTGSRRLARPSAARLAGRREDR